MCKIRHANIKDLPCRHRAEHEGYEYIRRDFVRDFSGDHAQVSVYEIPPGKSAYPYHYHVKNEEVFYILSGTGILRTPQGESRVVPGDLVFFPADPKGAHKLTNDSETDTLAYIDFDLSFQPDVCIYPDSNKMGVWGKDTNRVFRIQEAVDYYDGE